MTGKLAVLILVTSTVLIVTSLPFPSHTNINVSCHNRPRVYFENPNYTIPRCHACDLCPIGMGMSVKCNGQVIKLNSNVSVHCVDCVTGKTFSTTNDHSQCTPCPNNICVGEDIIGMCQHKGDKRTCRACNDTSYYSNVYQKCMPCMCDINMSTNAKKTCQCKLSTTPEFTGPVKSSKGMETWKIVLIVLGILVIVVLTFLCYIRIVRRRLKIFKITQLRFPRGLHEWMCKILCCCYIEIVDGDGVRRTAQQNGHTDHQGKPCLIRLHSTPVTDNELASVSLPPLRHDPAIDGNSRDNVALISVCSREEFKVPYINAIIRHKMCIGLNEANRVRMGLGYVTLAGHMNYTHQQVQDLPAENPAGCLLEIWSETRGNNVLKLIELFKVMGMGNMADELENEVDKLDCKCDKCG